MSVFKIQVGEEDVTGYVNWRTISNVEGIFLKSPLGEPCTHAVSPVYAGRNLAETASEIDVVATCGICGELLYLTKAVEVVEPVQPQLRRTLDGTSRPNYDGGICHNCGGMLVRTGTCRTCTSCGTSDGCG